MALFIVRKVELIVDGENPKQLMLTANEIIVENSFKEFKQSLAKKAFNSENLEEEKDFVINVTFQSRTSTEILDVTENNYHELFKDLQTMLMIKLIQSRNAQPQQAVK